MNDNEKRLYCREIELQCSLAQLAVESMKKIMHAGMQPNQGPIEKLPPYLNMLYKEIHSLLTHAGNVSKLFWPTAKKLSNETNQQFEGRVPAIKRGRELRDFYHLDDSNELKQRTIRNNLEHFDEKLDAYAQELAADHDNGDFRGGSPGPTIAFMPPLKSNLIMRHYNPDTNEFIFKGKQFDLGRISAALVEIHEKSLALLA